MKKVVSFLLVVSMLLLLLAGCSSKSTSTTATTTDTSTSTKKKTVGFCLPYTTNSFMAGLSDGVKKAFEDKGMDCQIASADGDSTKQINQVENFVSSKTDLIIIMAVNPSGITDSLKKARAAGTKVLAIGTDTGEYDMVMKTDEKNAGHLIAEEAAQWIAKTFPDAKDKSVNVAILENRDDPEASKRADGLQDIETLSSKAKIVKTVGTGVTTDDGQKAAENLFQTNPDIKVIICNNSGMGLGVNAYVMTQGSAVKDKSKFATFGSDADDHSIAAVKDSATNKSVLRGILQVGGSLEDIVKLATDNGIKVINNGTYEKNDFAVLTKITADDLK